MTQAPALWQLVLVAAVVLGVWQLLQTMAERPRVSVHLRGRHMVVRMGGWTVLWSQRLWVRIPIEDVQAAAVDTGDDLSTGAMPVWGTVIPGVMRVGTVRLGGRREFWAARPDALLLRVELSGRTGLTRLMVQVPDPQRVADALRTAGAGLVLAATGSTSSSATPGLS